MQVGIKRKLEWQYSDKVDFKIKAVTKDKKIILKNNKLKNNVKHYGTESAGASAAAATADTFTNTTVAAINNPTACAATICYDNLTAILVTTTTAVSAG